MTARFQFSPRLGGAFCLLVLAACGCAQRVTWLEGPPAPHAPAPTAPPAAAPAQRRLDPPPEEPRLAPLVGPTRRVMVVVTERLDRRQFARRDSESESILSEKLLEPAGEPAIEVVRRGAFEEVLERDVESLALRGMEDSDRVLSNLLKAGIDYLAVGEISGSPPGVESGAGHAVREEASIHASVQVVRTDDGTVIAAGNADAEGRTLHEAKSNALSEAVRKLIESLRSAPPGPGARLLMITVDGLASFEEADRILRRLRETPGVLWSRDLRFSAGPSAGGAEPSTGGIARYEIGFAGPASDLQARLASLDPGLRLETTRVEGNHWSFHLAGKGPAVPEAPAPAGPAPPSPGAPKER